MKKQIYIILNRSWNIYSTTIVYNGLGHVHREIHQRVCTDWL